MSGALYRALFLLRTRLGPVALFAGTVYAAWLVFQDVGGRGAVLGVAQGQEVRLAPLYDARVESVAVEVGQQVEAGQVIVSLDPAPIDAQIQLLEAERAKVSAEIKATAALARQEATSETRRLATDLESAEVALAEATAEARSLGAELRATAEQRRKLAALVEQRMASAQDASEVNVRWAALKKQTEEAERSLVVLRERVDAARKRMSDGSADLSEVSAEPLRRELEGIERSIDDLQKQRSALVLRSPIAGQVSSLLVRPGEVAPAGVPVATVVGTASGRVFACVSETQAMSVRVGDQALLWPKGRSGEPLRGRTVSIGPVVAELPLRCRSVPSLPAWGREVVIQLDDEVKLLPGQAFDVRLQPEAELGGVLAADAVPPLPQVAGGPAQAPPVGALPAGSASEGAIGGRVSVPDALRLRTRFEPSALVWVPARSRYVVVSDDTGQKDAADHAPWLFTMDEAGHVDPEPLVVAGLEELNDLEGIASAGDGALWVLSSQSRSKKGKRPKSRQLFARLVPDGAGYRVDRSVHLAALLGELPAEEQQRLGLESLDDLNIEGLAADAEGLLLGLKGPVDAEGRAIIWRLRRPDVLVGTGSLAGAGLEPWGTAALTVTAEGRAVPGGIAELLALPDGRLLLASTASGIKTLDQTGSLWVAAGGGGRLDARRLRDFPGAKPEGLALSPRAGHVLVVFDADQGTPTWQELPWPP